MNWKLLLTVLATLGIGSCESNVPVLETSYEVKLSGGSSYDDLFFVGGTLNGRRVLATWDNRLDSIWVYSLSASSRDSNECSKLSLMRLGISRVCGVYFDEVDDRIWVFSRHDQLLLELSNEYELVKSYSLTIPHESANDNAEHDLIPYALVNPFIVKGGAFICAIGPEADIPRFLNSNCFASFDLTSSKWISIGGYPRNMRMGLDPMFYYPILASDPTSSENAYSVLFRSSNTFYNVKSGSVSSIHTLPTASTIRYPRVELGQTALQEQELTITSSRILCAFRYKDVIASIVYVGQNLRDSLGKLNPSDRSTVLLIICNNMGELLNSKKLESGSVDSREQYFCQFGNSIYSIRPSTIGSVVITKIAVLPE